MTISGPVEPQSLPPSDFTAVPLQPSYSTSEQPLARFYVPLLARATEYHRLVGYFSSTVLARAAAGFAPFVARGGTMQLVVGAQLTEEDVDAVLHGEPLDRIVAERLTVAPLDDGVDIVTRERLRVLAWMLREGRLDIRVGVPVDRNGAPLRTEEAHRYFHSKYGLLTDARGRQVAFIGSDNETISGWTGNHETLHVYWSWNQEVWSIYGQDVTRRFQRHWDGLPDAGWTVMAVPDAVRQALVDIVPAGWHPPLRDPDPRLRIPTSDSHDATETDSQATLATTEEEGDDGATVDLEEAQSVLLDILDAPLSRTFVGLTSATVVPLPHQVRIAVRAVETFPRGYLLADEVGLGKTVEAGLILRELLLSGRARTALLLVPASVLRQWQEELHEKLALDVPRYDRGQFRDRHDNELQTIPTANPWSAFPVLLASSHLARRADRSEQVLAAGPWDIVIVDEAHHARRRGLKATGSPNRLLTLLQTMRAAQAWKAIYLATATPMQMAPHEAWDLIELLGLPGAWGESADQFVRYFSHLRRPAEERDWVLLTRMLRDHLDQPDAPQDETLRAKVIAELGPARSRSVLRLHEPPPPTRLRISGWTATQQRCADDWLQAHTPMRDRVFRNTRSTMRDYQRQGLLPADLVIPRRHVHDEFIDLSGPERQLYDRIDAYIRRYYNAYMQQGGNPASQALGFVMTVYRRRLTSSFWAVRNSLARRRDNLTAGGHLAIGTLLDADDTTVAEDDETAPPDLQSTLLPHDVLAHLRDEVAELEAFIAGIDALGGHDSKAQQLDHDLSEAIAAGYDSVVVFTQYTDTMDFLRTRLAGLYQRVACYSGRGGEQWDPATGTWRQVSKPELKQRFRAGEVRILLGTDSMSEGLNLQTSGRLFNYDMPWNLMRVEQRIGRIDRIGAGHPVVSISNYYYANTVEQQIYTSIKADFGDFTEIIGDAQPVLAATEEAIRKAAMQPTAAATSIVIAEQVRSIQNQVVQATGGDVRLSDSEEPAPLIPTLTPSATLADLEKTLNSNPLTGQYLHPVLESEELYLLTLPGRPHRHVTFSRDLANSSQLDVDLLTWGSQALNDLRRSVPPPAPDSTAVP